MAQFEDSRVTNAGPRPIPTNIPRIGPGMVMRGDLSGSEDIVIQGVFEGRISLAGRTVHIDTKAEVTADIEAAEVQVYGTLTGNIRATGRIVLAASANLKGDIMADNVWIQDGAQFKGTIQMKKG